MKLGDNNLYPCCRQVPECSTLHILLCPHLTRVHTRDTFFCRICKWLNDIDTNSILLHIISTFWHNEELILALDCHLQYQTMYNILRDIGVHQIWKGLVPNHLVLLQNHYYQEIGSHRSATK